jgi:hypothetical protein
MSEQRPWHRLFGLSWTDFCEGSSLQVNPETDLSDQQQYVDLLLIRQDSGELPQPLPDGFDNLAVHNIVTFKSHQEPLDSWALHELIGHYVNYRKQISPTMKNLLAESEFQLYAVCVREPQALFQQVTPTKLQDGVCELVSFDRRVRIIVVQQLPLAEQNALLHLFSTQVEQLRYARTHYKPRTQEMTTLFYDLVNIYTEEPTMSDALKEYARERIKELLKGVPAEERLEGISPEKRLEGISPEKRLEGIPMEKLLEKIPQQMRLEGMSAEEVIQALSPEQKKVLETLLRQPKTDDLPEKQA